MLPKISLFRMVMAVETMTSMKTGSVAGGGIGGGKLCLGLELQHWSSSGPPEPALTSHTCTWLTGSAKPLKLGSPVKLPPVTWFAHEWPQKFTSCPSCNPPAFPPHTTNDVDKYTMIGVPVSEGL